MNPSTRLFVLLARNAPFGVIFRRGPSNQVLLIKWDIERDTFEYGQWLRGRIYERRCDLSPEGDMLLYFAANWRKPYQSWSAISRPPFLTALALWPKGDGWGGGGLFVSRDSVLLNHRTHEAALAQNTAVPTWLSVAPFGDRPGWGEDDPLWSARLQRDGWRLTTSPKKTKDDFGAKVWIEYEPPITWERAHPLQPDDYTLRMSILGMKEQNGPWYLVEHSVTGRKDYLGTIGRSDWADWSPNGDLLFAQSGCLFRLGYHDGILKDLEESEQIVDFSALRFEGSPPADFAREWPSRKLQRKGRSSKRGG
jgi:hypothetical protein